MRPSIGARCMALLGGSLLVLAAAGTARAQVSSDPAEITRCLCMEHAISTLSADMSAKTQALAAVRQHLAALDAQLENAKRNEDVNNPSSVANEKAILEQRDATYQQSLGPVVGDADQATARYNAEVGSYNGSCANRDFDSVIMAQISAHLSCPPLH
ncbi:MAG TPA: hypothetical protein VMF05_11155 [Stellaceae bacterium]|nr:hypothetical protein [Stellaceae bacterium]